MELKDRPEEFGPWVKRLLDENNIGPTAFAATVGKSYTNIYPVLKGDVRPNVETVKQYVEALLKHEVITDAVEAWTIAGFVPNGYVVIPEASLVRESAEIEYGADPDAQWIAESYMGADDATKAVFRALADTVTVHHPDGTTEEMSREEALRMADHSGTSVGKRAE